MEKVLAQSTKILLRYNKNSQITIKKFIGKSLMNLVMPHVDVTAISSYYTLLMKQKLPFAAKN